MTEIPKKQDGRDESKEISIFDLLSVLFGQKRLILITVAAFVAASAAIAVFSTPYYRASATLTVVPVINSVNPSAALGALSNFVSLGGRGALSGGKDAEYIAIMRSRILTERFIKDNNLLPILFADRWDSDGGSWEPHGQQWPIRTLRKLLRWASGEPEMAPGDGSPSLWLAYQRFEEIRSVAVDPENGIVTLGIEWTDAGVAAEWANKLVDAANQHIRSRAAEEAAANIAFLSDEAQKTQLTQLQETFYVLIARELEAKMMSNVRKDFAFKVIDPAVAPEMRARPKRFLVVSTGLIVGFLVGGLIALFRHAYAEDRKRRL